MLIGVSCLDDLLGTDHKALLRRLKERYSIDFQMLKMNPIATDSKNPPGVNIQRRIYSLISTSENRKDELNLIGCYVTPDENNELFEVLKLMGISKVKNIIDCDTYEEFKDMGNSAYNLVLRPEARRAAEDMKKENNIDYSFMPVSYDLDEIKSNYETIKNMVGYEEVLDLKKYEEKAIKEIEKAKEIIKDMPISIDHSSVCRPYSLAKTLIQYGFNVESIYQEGLPAFEKESHKWLLENAPHVKIYEAINHNMILRDSQERKELISIGYNAGYMTQSKYVVDLVFDERMFGYEGICLLMNKMTKAYLEPADVKQLINKYGLVI